ncbi:MAG: hypothetical protein CMI54_08330 [Parcubacteria group bacterium]|nr:hypothetical protein [Parcubacteria group bacterium]|tara:strand:- start:3140 stop:3559 length:420 start_codon:yes stop_codon:yes gene_type:complete
MGGMTNVFIITLFINIMITIMSVTGDLPDTDNAVLVFFESNNETGDVSKLSGTSIGSVNPKNFTASSVNTGDPANTDFRITDTIAIVRTGFGLIASTLIAPLKMALDLDWPNWLTLLVAVPLTMLFWISMLLTFRGVST